MSVYVTIDGVVGPQLASNVGWGDFVRWAESLPAGAADDLKHLVAYGWDEDLAEVHDQLSLALEDNPPSPDVVPIAEALLGALEDADGVVTITDGMTSGEPTENFDPDQPRGPDGKWASGGGTTLRVTAEGDLSDRDAKALQRIIDAGGTVPGKIIKDKGVSAGSLIKAGFLERVGRGATAGLRITQAGLDAMGKYEQAKKPPETLPVKPAETPDKPFESKRGKPEFYAERLSAKDVKAVVEGMAKDINYHGPLVLNPGEGPLFNVGGKQWREAGNCQLSTGRVTIHDVNDSGKYTESSLRGLHSHEMMHGVYEHVQNKYVDEHIAIQSARADAGKKYDDEHKDNHSLAERSKAVEKASPIQLDAMGTLKPEHADKFPVYAALNKFGIDNQHSAAGKKLAEDDGVTEYSRAYWRDYKAGKVSFHIAVHETLAEMAREHDDPGPNQIGSPLWNHLYHTVRSQYAALRPKTTTNVATSDADPAAEYMDHYLYVDDDFKPTTPDKATMMKYWRKDGSVGWAFRP